jgi:hypothetical protein
MINEHKANPNRQIIDGITKIRMLGGILHNMPILDPLPNEQSGLIQLPTLETKGQRRITLSIKYIIINLSIQQIQNTKKEILLASIMQRSPMIDIDDV